jgi:hypothetical protein
MTPKGVPIQDEFTRLPYVMRWRARNIARGLCPSCGKSKEGSSLRFCHVCQVKHNKRCRDAYYRRKAERLGTTPS